MSNYRSILSFVVMGVLAFGMGAQAVERELTIGNLKQIPSYMDGPPQLIYVNGVTAGLADPAEVYVNVVSEMGFGSYVAVPGCLAYCADGTTICDPYYGDDDCTAASVAGPCLCAVDEGGLWMAEDADLALPNGATSWMITDYAYQTTTWAGAAPYSIHSALYKYESCTTAPDALVDYWTWECCTSPVLIPGTDYTTALDADGGVRIYIHLDAPVLIPELVMLKLTWYGDAAGLTENVGWYITEWSEVGDNEDFWSTFKNDADGCGAYWFGPYPPSGGAPYPGFWITILGESAAVMDMIPEATSGPSNIVGNVATIDCHDLPQDVDIAVYGRDWSPNLCQGFQTQIGCDSYDTSVGTLVAIDAYDAVADPYDPFTIRCEEDRADYIFNTGFAACVNDTLCPDAINGAYSCLHAAFVALADTGPKYMCHYAFEVGADTRGYYEIELDPRTLYTQLSDDTTTPIIPLARNPAFVGTAVGRCCYDLGPASVKCTDSIGGFAVTECDCEALATSLSVTHDFAPGEVCGDTFPWDCPTCLGDDDCYDNDACTIDTCVDYVCYNTPVVLDADECCDPTPINLPTDVGGLGAQASNFDGDPCTLDQCDPGSGCAVGAQCGVPINPNDPGARCCELQPDNPAKAVACTYNDTCNYYCIGVDGPIQPLVECGGEPPGFCEGFEPMAVCEWGCHGIDVNTFTCTTDDDCVFDGPGGLGGDKDMGVGGPCGPQSFECKEGKCYCAETTRVWLDVVNSEDCCFEEGDPIEVVVKKTAGADTITGTQFVVYYDPDCVAFDSFDLSADYPLLLYDSTGFDPVLGQWIFIAVGIQPFTGDGTADAADLAYLHFHCKEACEICQICLGQAENPPNTVLVNDAGEHVTMMSWGCSNNGDECEVDADCEEGAYCGCTCMLIQLGDEMIVVPDDVETNSDCMAYSAMVTWDTPAYWISECGFQAELDCYGLHEPYEGQEEDQMSPLYVEGLIEGGGEFAQGITTFCCDAIGLCDIPISECWTVEVTDQNAMDVIVEYSPPMKQGPYTRAIIFELFANCYDEPIVECRDMVFGPPFDFPGKATEVLKVDKTQLLCVTARDPLHTLRSVDMPIECVGNAMVVQFHGDPELGGNWLINGNLNGDHHIDVVDFGIFLMWFQTSMSKNTLCPGTGVNADIDGNGWVGTGDFVHIAMNFAKESKDACCDDPTVGWKGEPTLSITVKELRRRGMGELAIADLNGDGVLDQADMTAFMQGAVPVTPVRDLKRSSVRSLGR